MAYVILDFKDNIYYQIKQVHMKIPGGLVLLAESKNEILRPF